MRLPIASVVLFLLFGSPAFAQIVGNGSFEDVPGPASGQGILPSGWDLVTISPDTYSNDASYGLAPSDFGNFTDVTAFDGIRWVAGASFGRTVATGVGGESFGTVLTSTLTPGAEFTLNARLYQSVRPDLDDPGGYDLFLAEANTESGLTGAVFLGTIAPTTGVDAWEARSVAFTAPVDAGSRPFLIFSPYEVVSGNNSYPGIDVVTITPEPGAAFFVSLAALAHGIRRRDRR